MKSGGVLQRMLRHYSPQIRARGTTIRRFAAKTGLVYFGSVDQHKDEHEVIRGLTVSTTHQDVHYAVGSFDEYDVSIADRFDVVIDAHGIPSEHTWMIFKVALRNSDIPHVFLKPLGHSPAAYDKLFTAFNTLNSINSILDDAHSHEFHARYDVHSAVTHAQHLEQTLTPQVTQAISARFWPHAVEIFEGSLYVYITEHRLNETVLGSTLQSTVWLASVLDGLDQ
jgi:hypothetical protein